MDGWMSRDDGMRICMEGGKQNGNNTLWRRGGKGGGKQARRNEQTMEGTDKEKWEAKKKVE